MEAEIRAIWAVGFGMGYRSGVKDAKLGDIIKAEASS